MHHRGKALCCLILVGSLFLLGGCGGSGSGDGGGGGTPTPDITPISWLNGPWGFTGGSGRWSGNSFSGPMTLVRGEYLIENVFCKREILKVAKIFPQQGGGEFCHPSLRIRESLTRLLGPSNSSR